MHRTAGRLARITAVAAVAGLAVTGCAASGSPEAADDSIYIVYSVDKIDENQNKYIGYMEDRIAELADEGVDITFEAIDANGSVDKQLSDVQTILAKQPDVLIFSAVDATGSLPAVQAAKDAGVYTVDFRPSDPEPPQYDVAFGASETDYAAATTEWMQSLLDADPDLVLQVGLIYGAAAQTAQLEREDAIKEFADQVPDRVQILAEQYGNWQIDIAQNTAADWMQAYPEMNLISAANAEMALGASNALTAAGTRDQVWVSGYDINDSSLSYVEEGLIDFTTGVLAPDYGQIIDVAVGLVEGTFEGDSYAIEPVYSVTSENVADVLAKFNG
jgi:ABC-type sugar transport system substrate-binding protein